MLQRQLLMARRYVAVPKLRRPLPSRWSAAGRPCTSCSCGACVSQTGVHVQCAEANGSARSPPGRRLHRPSIAPGSRYECSSLPHRLLARVRTSPSTGTPPRRHAPTTLDSPSRLQRPALPTTHPPGLGMAKYPAQTCVLLQNLQVHHRLTPCQAQQYQRRDYLAVRPALTTLPQSHVAFHRRPQTRCVHQLHVRHQAGQPRHICRALLLLVLECQQALLHNSCTSTVSLGQETS